MTDNNSPFCLFLLLPLCISLFFLCSSVSVFLPLWVTMESMVEAHSGSRCSGLNAFIQLICPVTKSPMQIWSQGQMTGQWKTERAGKKRRGKHPKIDGEISLMLGIYNFNSFAFFREFKWNLNIYSIIEINQFVSWLCVCVCVFVCVCLCMCVCACLLANLLAVPALQSNVLDCGSAGGGAKWRVC